MLAALVVTQYVELPYLARYDWLVVFAIAIQAFMLLARLEKPREVVIILVFHLVGLAMEVFKTSSQIGSWSYPDDSVLRVGNVPLFSGFMYAAVGSYLARAWRVFDLQFTNYPNRVATVVLALAIYANFFTHHFLPDIRLLLFAAVAALYWRSHVFYTVNRRVRSMPLIVGFALIAFFIWIAENIGTYSDVWLYPEQAAMWQPVAISKMGSWFLLMIISFIMIDVMRHGRRRIMHTRRKPSMR